ncbi:MAG TPA: hypothetical protein VGE74_10270 [Gemmata sp.]
MEWLTRPLTADGAVRAGPLDPARLADADLRNICLRMHAILNTVEMLRCEGRLLPVRLFDAIDTLAGLVRHGPQPRLADWASIISEFGAYYGLAGAGAGPIAVEPACWRQALSLVGAPNAEPGAAPDTAI